jgi:hypothetical protein
MPRGKRPSTAARTRFGARNASDIVMLTWRPLHAKKRSESGYSVLRALRYSLWPLTASIAGTLFRIGHPQNMTECAACYMQNFRNMTISPPYVSTKDARLVEAGTVKNIVNPTWGEVILGEGKVGQLLKVATSIDKSAEVCPVLPHPSRHPRRAEDEIGAQAL